MRTTEVPPSLGTVNPGPTPVAQNAPRPVSASGTEEVIPLAEEQLEVGKRMVDRGVTRVRRYVVERPVEQDVTLRGERVTIERRRPIETTRSPGRAFEERVVEVHETEEVPVVAKTARVVEEVAIRKEETERTETVRDTVRREDVEVSDEQGAAGVRDKSDAAELTLHSARSPGSRRSRVRLVSEIAESANST